MGFEYCEVVEIARHCYLIVGRHLNLSKGEADVANSVLYKNKNILYILDTGVAESFGHKLREFLGKHPEGLGLEDVYHVLLKSETIQSLPAGANPNPLYAKLQILSKFRDLGIVGDSTDLTQARFQFQK